MHTVGLSWQHSFETAAALALTGGLAALPEHPKVRAVGAFARECATIAGLYGLWRLAGYVSLHDTGDAMGRAKWIERTEHDWFLPSEASVQRLIVGHSWIAEPANLYYATMHFTMMFVFLLWLFWRHRDKYRPVRQVMAWTTLGCLLIQLVPVAPPRMLQGYVDTAALYNQSVYSGGLAADQLSAMPSVHVAWAVFVGYYTWRIASSRWRWLGPAHAAITVFVVISTGNHWWADGIVGVAVLAVAAWSIVGTRAGWRVVFARLRPTAPLLRPPLAAPAAVTTTADNSVQPS